MMSGINSAARALLDAFGGNVPDWLQAEAAALEQALAAPPLVPTVVINITGGMLQGASANAPVDVISLDFDHEGVPDTGLYLIPADDGVGEASTAIVGGESAKVDPAWVQAVIDVEPVAPGEGDANDPGRVCPHCGEPLGGFHNPGDPCGSCNGLVW